VTVIIAATALLAAACFSGGGNAAHISAPPPQSLHGTLTGNGSTFQVTFLRRAISGFKSVQPGLTIHYVGDGSGKGRAALAAGVVNFAGSDTAPIPAAELASFKGKTVLYFPVLIGPITVSYDLPGVRTLRLSAPVIAGIFEGSVTKWSDPAIAADNPGVKLPGTAIVVAHRSDSSGTTQNFTRFLVDAAPRVWQLGSGSLISWPARSRAARGNEGVAAIVKSTPGAIGYVDLAHAKAAGLTYALIKNMAGRYVVPSPVSASAAASQVSVEPDLVFSAIWAPGASSYPITYQSWELVYQQQPNATDAKMLLAWLGYLLGDGQNLLLGLNYAPLPSGIDQMAVDELSRIAG
jgi:phosphate transport system substrate-binding protein